MYPKHTFTNFFYFFLSFNLLTMRIPEAQKTPIEIKVGLVVETDNYIGQMALNCISMALSDFYAAYDSYNTRLVLINRDSKEDIVGAAAAAVDLLKNVEVQAIIGPLFSMQANFMIALGDKAQVPIITFSASSPSLSSLRSPYFIRATLNDSSQVQAIGAIIQAYRWREVVLIYEDNVFGEGIIPSLTDALEQVNARVIYRSVIPPLATDDQIEAQLYKLMTMQTRVFIVHMMKSHGSRFFIKAKQLGLMSEDYVWITTDGMVNELSSTDHSIIESMTGVVGVRPFSPKTKELDDFTIQYKKRMQQNNPTVLTPELNIYGKWAYDAATALAIAAEKAKLGNPRIQDANISRNATDLESFGVSDAGPKLIRALSSISFRGLAGKFKLADGQLQEPPYEIVNIVGKGEQVIGYWTKDNGITKDLKFGSANANTYSTSKFNFKTTIWPGNRSYPAKGWVIPTKGKKLRVGVPVKESDSDFMRVKWNSDNSIKIEGYCKDVFDAVMSKLPYGVTYDFVPFTTRDHNMTDSYDDLVYQVYLGNYDAVAGDVTIVANRSEYVDFTLPYMESGISMVVPFKDDKTKNAWVFLKPLTWELWLTSLASFVFIGVLIWILEHRINEDFRGPLWYQVGMIFWFAFSTMVFAHKERVISNLARFVLIIWFLVVLILTQSYTASLASMLTVQQLQPSVNDMSVLLKGNEYVGYKKGSFVHGFLTKMKFDKSRLVVFNSPAHLDELFMKGSENGGIAAAFDEIPYIKVFLAKYCSKYTMTGPVYNADGFGFVFPIGSPLVPDISRAVLNFTEDTEIMEIIERKWFGDKICVDSKALISQEKSLGLESFWGLFLIVGIAGILAFTIYLVMFIRQNWHVIERSNPESTIWKKAKELFHRFDNRDLSCHTFKDLRLRDKDLGSGIDSHENYQQSPFSLPTPGTCENYQQTPFSLPSPGPSPMFSTPSDQNIILQRDQESSTIDTAENTQMEVLQMVTHENELDNRHDNENINSTSAQTLH